MGFCSIKRFINNFYRLDKEKVVSTIVPKDSDGKPFNYYFPKGKDYRTKNLMEWVMWSLALPDSYAIIRLINDNGTVDTFGIKVKGDVSNGALNNELLAIPPKETLSIVENVEYTFDMGYKFFGKIHCNYFGKPHKVNIPDDSINYIHPKDIIDSNIH